MPAPRSPRTPTTQHSNGRGRQTTTIWKSSGGYISLSMQDRHAAIAAKQAATEESIVADLSPASLDFMLQLADEQEQQELERLKQEAQEEALLTNRKDSLQPDEQRRLAEQMLGRAISARGIREISAAPECAAQHLEMTPPFICRPPALRIAPPSASLTASPRSSNHLQQRYLSPRAMMPESPNASRRVMLRDPGMPMPRKPLAPAAVGEDLPAWRF